MMIKLEKKSVSKISNGRSEEIEHIHDLLSIHSNDCFIVFTSV
jgi:hypothetical protein